MQKDRSGEDWRLREARTLVPSFFTVLVLYFLHGVLIAEPHSHSPTPASPLHWAAVHLIHPFNVLAIISGLIMAPDSMLSRLLASKPFLVFADLSYAMYLLHWGVITLYVVLLDKDWISIYGDPLADDDDYENELYASDFVLVVLITTVLAFPVTKWLEPAVRAWLKSKMGP